MAHALQVHHYGKGDVSDDNGWGCVYRCLQMLISTIDKNKIPTMRRLMQFFGTWPLYTKGERSQRLWLEPPDAARYLWAVHGIRATQWLYLPSLSARRPSAMLRYAPQYYRDTPQADILRDWDGMLRALRAHFAQSRCPVVVDNGTSAYILADIQDDRVDEDGDHTPFLIVDPHVTSPENAASWMPPEFLRRAQLWMMCTVLR